MNKRFRSHDAHRAMQDMARARTRPVATAQMWYELNLRKIRRERIARALVVILLASALPTLFYVLTN